MAADRKFEGFPPEKQTWNFPTLLNGWVHELSGAEFKVLWYIVRHTFGWQKTEDAISYEQFQQGIRRQDGTWLDKGTGLGRRAIAYSLKKLEEMGFIERISGSKRGKTGFYKLKFADATSAKMKDPPCKNETGTSAKRKLPPCKNETGTSAKRKLTIYNNQSLTRQSLSQRSKHNKEAQAYSDEWRERLLSGLKKIYPGHSFEDLLLKEPEKVDYFLWKVESGEINPHLIKSPVAYIKSMTVEGSFKPIQERDVEIRKKREKVEEEKRRIEKEMQSIDWEGNRKKLKHLLDSLDGR